MRCVKIGKLQVEGQGSLLKHRPSNIKFSVSDHILIIRISYLKMNMNLLIFCAKLWSTVLKKKCGLSKFNLEQ